jgi:hypothetical protein
MLIFAEFDADMVVSRPFEMHSESGSFLPFYVKILADIESDIQDRRRVFEICV